MERTGLSSVIKLFSEALCATRAKIMRKEDCELTEKKYGVNRLWNASIHYILRRFGFFGFPPIMNVVELFVFGGSI